MDDRKTLLESALRDAVSRGRATSPQWIYVPLTLALDELTGAQPNDPNLHEVIGRAQQALDLWRSWLGEASAKRG